MNNNVLEFLITAKDEASEKLKGISANAKQIGATMTVVGGAITAAMGFAVKAAADAQVQMAKFDTTLKNSKGTTDAVRSALLKAADATLKLGFDNEDAANSLAKFFQRTGSVTTAIKLNTVAMDLSRAKNIDLATAGTLVNQVLSGNGKVLKQYGIDLKEAGTPLEALNQLHEMTKGSSEAFSQTLQGQTEIMKQNFGELQESIGAILIPILTDLFKKLVPIIDGIKAWTEAHPELTKYIVIAAAAIGGLLVVLGPLLIMLPTLITLFTVLSGPVGIVIAIITALAWTISNIVQIIDLLQNHWKEVWEGIKISTKEMLDAIVAYFQPFIDKLTQVYNLAVKVKNAVGNAVGGTISGAVSEIKYLAGKRAEGGPVSGGSSYLVGERGPEIFTPAYAGNITPNGAGGAINININGAIFTKDAANEMSKQIMDQLKRVSRIGI